MMTISNFAQALTTFVLKYPKSLRRDFRNAFRKVRGRIILTDWSFERAFQRDIFLFRPFSTFRETTLERVMNVIQITINT